jgi:hypothetical protein
MTEQLAALPIDEELPSNFEWEWDFSSLAIARIKRLQEEKLTLPELIEEINDATLEAYTYFCGLDDEAQRRVARDMKDVLMQTMAAKAKVREWARKELARRTNPNSMSVRLSEDLRNIKADFKARHPNKWGMR